MNLNLTVALNRIVQVKQSVQFLEVRVTKVLQRHAKLHGSVVAAMHLMQTSVKVCRPFRWHVIFEQDAVAVARCLVFLVNVFLLVYGHLVSWEERDWLFLVTWIVAMALSVHQLVDRVH